MIHFAKLLNELYFTQSNKAKLEVLIRYFRTVKDPDRGYALSVIADTLQLSTLKPALLKQILLETVDPYLAEISYHYVGDLSETIALLWPDSDKKHNLPNLAEVIERFQNDNKKELMQHVIFLLNNMDASQRWALLKIVTGSLRIGVSARFVKIALSEFGNKPIQEIEEVWHATSAPYVDLFAWLEDRGPKPHLNDKNYYHPVMLSHPLTEKDMLTLNGEEFFVEWKYDGIRVQLVITHGQKALYSRTGDDITHSFQDVVIPNYKPVILDGELVIKNNDEIGVFNNLQKRLNKKNPTIKFMQDNPAHIILYDMISLHGEDISQLPLTVRRQILETWYNENANDKISLSELLSFKTHQDLINLRNKVTENPHPVIEGLMIKRKDSSYITGLVTRRLLYCIKRNFEY